MHNNSDYCIIMSLYLLWLLLSTVLSSRILCLFYVMSFDLIAVRFTTSVNCLLDKTEKRIIEDLNCKITDVSLRYDIF